MTPAAAAPSGIDTSEKLPELQKEKSVPGGPVPVPGIPASETAKKATRKVPEPEWPGKARAEVELPTPAKRGMRSDEKSGAASRAGAGFRAAGDLPVSIGRPASGPGRKRQAAAAEPPGRVEVQTFGQGKAKQLGLAGTILRVSDAGGAAGKPISVRVDYSKFKHAYGANYGSRLRLVRYPACALTTPEKVECRAPQPLPSRNNVSQDHVTADVVLSAKSAQSLSGGRSMRESTMVLALAADADSSAGTFAATKLAPSGSWSAGGSSGNFTYTYPLAVPPSPGEAAPKLSLDYSAQSLDGRTSTTNNQASVVGDGWSLGAGGYIERSYETCAKDLGGNQGQRETGDRCWVSDNATMVLGGVATELVKDSETGQWRPKNDDGSRIEHLFGAANGDDNGEYWKVTSPDGTQYFLGVNRLPGWTEGDPETNSTWTVPVYGNNPGEPCHAAEFDSSWCQQAWRWNLSYSVEPQGNVITYYYGAEKNHYGRNRSADKATPYVRGGYLKRIEYGLRDSDYFDRPAARVLFTMAERCLPTGEITCKPEELTESTAEHWPDVPFDQICAAGDPCEYQYAPTFFSRKRLKKVTTQVSDGSRWRDVDSWTLRHQFPDSGDGLAPALWLAGITHTGHVDGTESTPETVFGGRSLPNRVDAREGIAPITRYRLISIRNSSGGYTKVKYSEPQCVAGQNMPASPEHNTMRCFPTWWTPEYAPEPILDWFHKYVVTDVVQDARTGGSSLIKTAYEYVGGAAWHYDDREFADPEHRTWSSWRGYGTVREIVGAPGTTQSVTETTYLRGMDGDRLPGGGERDVWVTDSQGGRTEDHEHLRGFPLEVKQFNEGKVVSASIKKPWLHGPTATNGDDRAYVLKTGSVHGRTLLESGEWQRTEVTRTFNEQGLVTEVDDAGDVAVEGDESCTRTTYARNEQKWMLSYPASVHKVALPCSAGKGTDADLISDVRSFYDGQEHGLPPTRGNVTRVERWNGSEYVTVAETSYDAYGRVVQRSDAKGATTKIDYVPDTGPVTEVVTTNALGHVYITELAPGRGNTVAEIGPNGERSDAVYDPLGRLLKAWLPGQSKADGEKPDIRYAYHYRTDAPTVVVTESLRDDGDYNTSYTLYDGLLRKRQTQIPAVGGGRIITDTWYDSRGLAYKTNAAYYNKEAPSDTLHGVEDWAVPHQNITEFDGMARPTAVIYRKLGEEQWRTTTSYGGDRVHVTPPEGGVPTTVISNAQGKIIERRQYHGDTTEGAYDATTLTYTREGRLESVTDPAGNTWHYGYDVLGRKISMDDPDRGRTTYRYNELDQLVSTTDSRGKTLAYSYDVLGRKTAMYEGGLDGTKLAEWTYDTLKKGQPTASIRYVDGQAYIQRVTWYDEQNRVTASEVVVPEREGKLAGTYRFRTSYTRHTDKVAAETVPGVGGLPVERIYHNYNKLGMPTKTYGIDTYAQEHLYSPYGETLRLTLGEGAQKTWITNYYQEGTRRLEQTVLDRNTETGYRIGDRRYTYDLAGNITRIADVPKGRTADVQCFEYDYLRRLVSAHTPASGDCSAEPSVETLGGAAPYWVEFTYDKVGNRISEVSHTPEGKITRSYEYPPAGSPQPHAVLAVNESGPRGESRDEFTYDSTGNMITRTIAGDTRTLEWNSEGRLARTVAADGDTSSYVYDASGDRLVKREPGQAKLYLPGMELTLDTESGEVTGKRYYTHGGSTVAVRSSTGGVTMLLGNHQGTGLTSVAAADLAVTRRYFTPFGKPRGEEPASWPTDKGFVGGEQDASGLTHLGAREYDPALGRFISVDPIMDLADPQQIHGYSYANNSPVTFSDPSGLLLADKWRGLGGDDYGFLGSILGGLLGFFFGMIAVVTNVVTQHISNNSGTASVSGASGGGGSSSSGGSVVQQASRQVGVSSAEYENLRRVAASKKTWWDHTVQQLPSIAADLVGITDIKNCVTGGGVGACVSAIIGAIPWTKMLKAFKAAGKIYSAVKAGLAWQDKVADARRKLRKISTVAENIRRKGRASSCSLRNSFVPGTLVVMADGDRVPIESVEVGDMVLATDPATGETVARQVVATIVGQGEKDLVAVTVDTDGEAGGETGVVVATDGHPFWVAKPGRWVEAEDLRAGQALRTPSGALVEVIKTRAYTEIRTVHNLTINDLHTYSVSTPNGTGLLTHNCPAGKPGRKRAADLPPNEQAAGDHTVFEYGEDGIISRYQTWEKSDYNPNGWQKGARFRGRGSKHAGIDPPIYYPSGNGRNATHAPVDKRPSGY